MVSVLTGSSNTSVCVNQDGWENTVTRISMIASHNLANTEDSVLIWWMDSAVLVTLATLVRHVSTQLMTVHPNLARMVAHAKMK